VSPAENPAPTTTVERRRDDSIQTLLLYRVGRSTGWIAFFTLVIAIAGAAGGYFLWNQMNVMQDQSDQLQDLSEKLQKSFDASRTQSDALIAAMEAVAQQIGQSTEAMSHLVNTDRPWVGVDSVSIGPIQPGARLPVVARIRNSGRTPATDVRVSLATLTAPAPPGAASVEECKTCPRIVLLPNATETSDVSVESGVLTSLKAARLRAGEETIWLIGRIDYTDSSAHPHTTRVCMMYTSKSSAFSACPEGSRFD
jgi:hypothetical protein